MLWHVLDCCCCCACSEWDYLKAEVVVKRELTTVEVSSASITETVSGLAESHFLCSYLTGLGDIGACSHFETTREPTSPDMGPVV